MSNRRLDRVNEILKREIADVLYRVVNDPGFDIAAVTITGVVTSSDLRNARVLVSIRGHEGHRGLMLRRLASHRRTIQESIGKNVVLKYTPHVTFELDPSIEQGDRVLSIIAKLEAEAPAAPPEELEQEPEKDDDAGNTP